MKSTGHNSGFKKSGVTWDNQVKFFNQSFVLADSFVLRNPALLKPAKRYASCLPAVLTSNYLEETTKLEVRNNKY